MRKTKIPSKLPRLSAFVLLVAASLLAVLVIICLSDDMTPHDPSPGAGDPAFRLYIIQYAR